MSWNMAFFMSFSKLLSNTYNPSSFLFWFLSYQQDHTCFIHFAFLLLFQTFKTSKTQCIKVLMRLRNTTNTTANPFANALKYERLSKGPIEELLAQTPPGSETGHDRSSRSSPRRPLPWCQLGPSVQDGTRSDHWKRP